MLSSGKFRIYPSCRVILLGVHFDAKQALELGLVTQIVSDHKLLATETAQKLAEKPAGALRACKRLLKSSSREQVEQAKKAENEEFSSRLHSANTKEAMTAFLEKRPPDFSRIRKQSPVALTS
jgi:enoyl-CoA hydratase/carnithine racemase